MDGCAFIHSITHQPPRTPPPLSHQPRTRTNEPTQTGGLPHRGVDAAQVPGRLGHLHRHLPEGASVTYFYDRYIIYVYMYIDNVRHGVGVGLGSGAPGWRSGVVLPPSPMYMRAHVHTHTLSSAHSPTHPPPHLSEYPPPTPPHTHTQTKPNIHIHTSSTNQHHQILNPNPTPK